MLGKRRKGVEVERTCKCVEMNQGHIRELIDALGEQSKFPCNKSMNGVYDECAYRKVCVLKYKAVKHESNRENIDEGKSAFKVWLHCTMDAPTTYLPSRENKKYSEGCHFLVS